MRKETKRVAGLPLPLYLIMLGLLFPALRCGVIPAGLSGGLFLLLVFGEGLDELGESVPFMRTYLGGSVVCVLGGAAIGVSGPLPKDNTEILGHFMGNESFLIFYITTLITGSPFQIDRRLLFRASLHILPTALAGVAAGAAVVMLLGFLQGFSVTESLLYITIPMTSGGMTAGTVPFSAIYAEVNGIPTDEVLTGIAPATVLGNTVPILSGALTVRPSARFSELSGGGQFLRGEGAVQKKSMSQAGFGSLLTGFLLPLAFYTVDTFLHGPIPTLPVYAGMILYIMAAEGFFVLPGEMEEVATAWGQFVIRALTAAALTGIGIVLLDLNCLALVPTLPCLLTIVLGVLVITLITGFVGNRPMGFYPLEASITADIYTTSMGGFDNVVMLSAADHVSLLPFAQIATGSIGALTLTLGGILIAILLH